MIYLASVTGGEDSHGASALFYIPEEPESGNLMRF